MEPIDALMTEHRLIEKALGALVAYVEKVRRHDLIESGDLARFVEFIEEYADAYHRGKEEVLFAEAAASGIAEEGSSISVLLRDHKEGQRLVRELSDAARQRAPWTAEDRRRIAVTAKAFAAMLRAHIEREDGELLPTARVHLPEAAMARVRERFARSDETGEGGARRASRLEALARELIARHAPVPAPR